MSAGQIVRAFFNELRHTQFESREWIERYQHRLLESLVRHARAHVPFYRESGRLDPIFRANGAIDWERWGEIPLLTRKEVQGNFESLKSEFVPPNDGPTWTLTTSGSTGEPVKVVHTYLSRRIALTAQLLRDFERHSVDPTRRLAYLSPPSLDWRAGAPPKHRNYWFPGLVDVDLLGDRFVIADTQPASTLVESVSAIRPDYMRVQPIALQLMCANDPDGQLSALDLSAVLTIGEHFAQDSKRDVALHLGTRIIDQYGSVECGRIATVCPHCARFHVDAEVNFVEVIDEDGIPVKPGNSGWVIVTPFYNFAMPLIRYEHVDQAQVGEAGDCPINLPVLDEIFGKERVAFTFPHGHVLRPTVSTKEIVARLGAQAFQVAQVAEDRCEVRIVPGFLAPSEMQFNEMTEYLRSIWWKGLVVDYKIVQEIPRVSVRGKAPMFAREVGAETNASKAE